MTVERIELAPGYEISRIIRGGWQLSSNHSTNVSDDPLGDMMAFADAGITTFDCADIYTGVEDLIGTFRMRWRNERGADALKLIKVHTKFVPDLSILPQIDKAYVERVIDTSLRRLKLERLDLVQFHWWNYGVKRWLETASWLNELRQAGKINLIGGTNFDTDHMLEIIQSGVPLTSMQVQYSVLDHRPAKQLAQAAQQNGISLLCYGTVAGGFLSDRWLGTEEPRPPLENRSLIKYKLIIDEFGGWQLFQALLSALAALARKHHTDIATIASAAVLARNGVASVIVGTRNRSHLAANLQVSSIKLDHQDLAQINAVHNRSQELAGDVYGLERDTTGRHGSIMKYNLNSDRK